MKDDLISRKALREAVYHETFEMDSDMQKWDSGCWIRYKMFEKHLKDAPSIPAVPLDKLCEMFAKNADCPPEHSPVQDHCIQTKCAECWKSVLKEWMEEQNA